MTDFGPVCDISWIELPQCSSHAIIARAHLAKSEPEMTSDRFSFLELHNFVKSSAGSTNEKPDTFI
jgi:hypothetical protein